MGLAFSGDAFDDAAREIIRAGRRLAERGLVAAHSGNISCRLGSGGILITASGVYKGGLTMQDLLCVDDQGNLLGNPSGFGRRPSTEMALHLALYRDYPQIEAIVHAHPPYATAMACSQKELDWQLLEESALFLGPTPLLPRLGAGSRELAGEAAAAAKGVNALLLTGHGAVSWGNCIEMALCRMEILEHTAKVMLLAKGYAPQGSDDA